MNTPKKRKIEDVIEMKEYRKSYLEAVSIPFPEERIVPKAILERMKPIITFYSTTLPMCLAGLLPVFCSTMRNAKLQGFTKPALLKHLAENNIGVIGSDEMFGTLYQILSRSDQGAAGTGERALLCSLFTGGSHSIHYSARENVSVSSATTNLCVAGFTQPEKLKVLLDTMASQNDGLLDRQELNISRFDGSGYRLLEAVYNELVSRQLHDDKQFTDLAPCIGMRFQTRYIDYLGRIAMYQVLQHQIDGSQLVAIPEVIPYATLEMANELLDFLTLQKEVLLESIIPERKTYATDLMQLDPIAISVEERACKNVLLIPGFAASIRDIQRAMKKTTTFSALERYLRRIESEQLGKLIGAKRKKRNFFSRTLLRPMSSWQSFKSLPQSSNKPCKGRGCLRKFKV